MARSRSVSLLAGALALAFCAGATAQPAGDAQAAAPEATARNASHPPAYDTPDQEGPPTGDYNTPEADGRPGEYYFQLGVNAYYKKDYAHAIQMYKVAASWAYKPAEFNLGLIYFQGLGVPADRPRGAAWMSLAAERSHGGKIARARDLMLGKLDKAEAQRAFAIWQELKPTYGDEVALARAKTRWAQVKSSMTGSRVGDGAVHLLVGGSADHVVSPGPPSKVGGMPGSVGGPMATSAAQLFRSGGATDGSIAYQQFQRSDNPYDVIFRSDLTGTTSVGPLTPVQDSSDKSQKKQPAGDGHDR
jgi:TPR repeat protein